MIEQRYVLVIRRGKNLQVVGDQDFEHTARTIAALYEEGYKEVELWVTNHRKAIKSEMDLMVDRARELLAD
jgi:hypothetical protein